MHTYLHARHDLVYCGTQATNVSQDHTRRYHTTSHLTSHLLNRTWSSFYNLLSNLLFNHFISDSIVSLITSCRIICIAMSPHSPIHHWWCMMIDVLLWTGVRTYLHRMIIVLGEGVLTYIPSAITELLNMSLCQVALHAYIHADIHTCMHTYIHTYTHTYIHTYTHTHIHTQNPV